MIILRENTFVNLVALSRFTPFRSISEENCVREENQEKINKVKKIIDNYTFFYGFVYFVSILALMIGVSSGLKIMVTILLSGLIVGSFIGYFGLTRGFFQVERRAFMRELTDRKI